MPPRARATPASRACDACHVATTAPYASPTQPSTALCTRSSSSVVAARAIAREESAEEDTPEGVAWRPFAVAILAREGPEAARRRGADAGVASLVRSRTPRRASQRERCLERRELPRELVERHDGTPLRGARLWSKNDATSVGHVRGSRGAKVRGRRPRDPMHVRQSKTTSASGIRPPSLQLEGASWQLKIAVPHALLQLARSGVQ